MLRIIKYRTKDFKALVQCLVELQDFLIEIDNLKRLRRTKQYQSQYIRNTFKKVKKHQGVIYLAFDKQKIAGAIVGIIEKQAKANLMQCVPTKAGRVEELFVAAEYRKQGLGKMLLKKIEKYFKQQNCDLARIEVFSPNKNARKFYQKMQYQERVVDLIKILK